MKQNDDILLIQVVPKLTPGRCGVSDHAIMLADGLRSSYGIDTAFVILNSEERCNLPYRTVHCNPDHLLSSCCMLSGKLRSAVLVHVSGYGYSRDGAPKALANAIDQVRDSGRFPIAAYFHELYATGAPWRSAFWYSRRQQREVARIAQICSVVVTNTAQHGSWLEGVKQPSASLQVLPVFSNIGDSTILSPWASRKPALLVFGQSATRQRAYKQLLRLESFLFRLGIEEVLDVGAETETPRKIGSLEVHRMGRMSATDLAKLISSVQFGFVRFTPGEMAKSSVMASLCAFGAAPVLAHSFDREIDGIRDGREVITPNTVENVSFSQCSRAAWNWYQQHNLDAHARVYSQWLAGNKAREAVAR